MWLNIQIFGFRALWSPYFFIFCVALGVIYYLITGPYRHKFGGDDKPAVKQHIFIYTALFLLYAVKGSPIDLLSHIMLTAHMTQMAVYLLIFPILIIKGIPVWIWEKIIHAPISGAIMKILTKPVISLVLFNLLFSLYHIPVVFDFSKSSAWAHTSISVILLLSAFIMFLPVLSPVKELDKITPLLKIGYILAGSVLILPACVLIIFADTPLFASYSSDGAWLQALSLCVPADVLQGFSSAIGPEMFTNMDTLFDQQLGGIIMKTIQEVVYGVLYGTIFFKWFNNRDNRKIDPIPEGTNF